MENLSALLEPVLLREIFSFITLLAAFALLVVLIIIDFKVRLLPNKYVFPYAALGLSFHAILGFSIFSIETLLVGGAMGYGLLWIVRELGSRYYGQEALGLGDVKLMGAAGLWLGAEYMALALTIGASLSILHGVVHAITTKQSLHRLQIPAGPGLIGGIIIMTLWMIMQHKEWVLLEFFKL